MPNFINHIFAEDSFLKHSLEKMVPAITLFRPLWRILAHPFTFQDYRTVTAKQIVTFFFACFTVSAFFWKPEQSAVDLASVQFDFIIRPLNDIVHRAFPKYDVSLWVLIPTIALICSVLFGLIFHALWRIGRYLLSDHVKSRLRNGHGISESRLRATIGACVYTSGLCLLLLTVLPALAVVLSKELNYSGGTVSLNFRVESVRDVIAFVITLLWLYLFFIVTVAAPFWFSNIYGLRLATSYIISVASLAILVLPPSFAKQTPLEQYGFAENWVASGFLLYFDYGSDQILENYKPVLNHVAAVALKAAQSHALESVEISGGIDTAEVVENPPDLAWRRGVSVGQALTALGVPGEYIFARSLAAGHQLVFTPKNTKKPENRFVTITIRAYGAVINAANANGEPETPR